ncbi:MAG: hypothetical protein FWF99_00170 [Desulfovibrionaceae bacterium]|nr:hypothetical protein [Desulfovibrionaceae bacterium]
MKTVMRKLVVYAPTLHPALLPAAMPDEVRFLCPGLPLPAEEKAGRFFQPENLPFAPTEASKVLEELLELGLRLAPGRRLKDRLTPEAGAPRLPEDEALALENFTNDGKNPGKHPPPANREDLRQAQKLLLLAWDHEENILALNALEDEVRTGEARLRQTLGEGDPLPEDTRKSAEKHVPDYDWAILLEALAAFLPPESLILSAHRQLRATLLEEGLLRPLSEDLRQDLAAWPENFTERLTWARVPLSSLAPGNDTGRGKKEGRPILVYGFTGQDA